MIQWSEAALIQLEEHHRFIELAGFNGSEVIARIMTAAEQLALNPQQGRKLANGLYKLTLKDPKYVIHYRPDSELIIVGVYHHRQNRPLWLE